MRATSADGLGSHEQQRREQAAQREHGVGMRRCAQLQAWARILAIASVPLIRLQQPATGRQLATAIHEPQQAVQGDRRQRGKLLSVHTLQLVAPNRAGDGPQGAPKLPVSSHQPVANLRLGADGDRGQSLALLAYARDLHGNVPAPTLFYVDVEQRGPRGVERIEGGGTLADAREGHRHHGLLLAQRHRRRHHAAQHRQPRRQGVPGRRRGRRGRPRERWRCGHARRCRRRLGKLGHRPAPQRRQCLLTAVPAEVPVSLAILCAVSPSSSTAR
mmetsp:Transcript_44474/g.141568  ORF Transcript_44474/g.141568 Transcript_44474/m.141568 type:complete len:273 (-) Transcript_44474:771-1589(-)